ncbi:MAG: PA2779 family protein [Gallionella sp.]
MNIKLYRRVGGLVLGAALCLQASLAMAGMVTPANTAGQNQTAMERARIQSFLDRADVKDRLQGLGVGEPMAKDRVAAMTDQEVHALAQKIDSLPAGGSLSNNDLILVLLIVLLVLLL